MQVALKINHNEGKGRQRLVLRRTKGTPSLGQPARRRRFSGVPEESHHDLEKNQTIAKRYVHRIARSWNVNLSLQEKEDVANMAVSEALVRYRPEFNTQFSSFLYYQVQGELKRWVGSSIKVSKEFLSNVKEDHNSEEDISARNHRIACRLGPENGLLASRISNPEEELVGRQLTEQLGRAFEDLDEVYRFIIQMYYYEGKTTSEIGDELGYSRSYVSLLKKEAVDTLKVALGRLGY